MRSTLCRAWIGANRTFPVVAELHEAEIYGQVTVNVDDYGFSHVNARMLATLATAPCSVFCAYDGVSTMLMSLPSFGCDAWCDAGEPGAESTSFRLLNEPRASTLPSAGRTLVAVNT